MVFGKKSMLGVTTAILFALTAACSAATTGTGEQPSALDDDNNGKTDAGPKPSPTPVKKDASPETVEPTPEPVAECPSGLFAKAACQSCFASKCKAECGSCGADEDCNTALTCLNGCTTESCFDACLDGLPATSTALLSDILGNTGCVETECKAECAAAPAPLKRTGDACTADSQCETGSCNGSWCSEYCVNNVDCGINSSGALVWCVGNSGGTNTCFPGCKTNSDCYAFSGTTCKSVTANNGASTKVCSI